MGWSPDGVAVCDVCGWRCKKRIGTVREFGKSDCVWKKPGSGSPAYEVYCIKCLMSHDCPGVVNTNPFNWRQYATIADAIRGRESLMIPPESPPGLAAEAPAAAAAASSATDFLSAEPEANDVPTAWPAPTSDLAFMMELLMREILELKESIQTVQAQQSQIMDMLRNTAETERPLGPEAETTEDAEADDDD